jgi:HD domain
MTGSIPELGTHAWTVRTGGRLTSPEVLSLLRPIVRAHATNAVGRLAIATRLNSGRRAVVDPAALMPPSSVLTLAAEEQAQQRLSPTLLNHSYRTYAFGAALGTIEHIDVDQELLFAAAMLHDIGLAGPARPADFTLASARVARDVAETVGLSTAATQTIRSAITMHHTPGVRPTDGAVAYLLSAGAGVDVMGLRSWKLPSDVLEGAVRERPRLGFKREFSAAFRAEAAAVPAGRARLLRRYGAFDLAIRFAPFSS